MDIYSSTISIKLVMHLTEEVNEVISNNKIS